MMFSFTNGLLPEKVNRIKPDDMVKRLTDKIKNKGKNIEQRLRNIEQHSMQIEEEFVMIEESKKNLINIVDCVDALIWAKDANHKYTFANETHCLKFLGLESTCKKHIHGKGDIELINDYMERTGNAHSYGHSCFDSDEYIRKHGEKEQFIEIGWIGNELLILYVSKTPHFNIHGDYIGSIGVAWDYSDKALFVYEFLKRSMEKNDVELLFHDEFIFRNSKKLFSYCYRLNNIKIESPSEHLRKTGFPQ